MNNSKKQNQIILLTGATGFLGSNILNDLIAKTGNKIIVLKRSTSETKFINQALKSKNTIAYDIDKIDIEEIFKSNKIETIIHCATTYGRGDRATIQVAKSNIVFPLELLIYALKYNVKNFINTDSYLNKENLKSSPEGLIDYSLSKQSLILWLKYYSEKIKIINIILEHPFGKNDNNKKFVQSTIEKIAIEKVNSLDFTKGTQLRDFIYIKDITSAYLKILEKINEIPQGYNNFELGTGISYPLKDFIEEIKAISKSPTILNFGKLDFRKNEVMKSKADNKNLINLGWKPKYDYKKALKEMLEKDKNGNFINMYSNIQ